MMHKPIGKSGLLILTNKGLYIPEWDSYVDPWFPVKNAIITHAHADHCRYGMKHYLAHTDSEGPIRARIHQECNLQTLGYRQSLTKGNVSIEFIPAGHIVGSSQVLISNQKEKILITGDFKTEVEGSCTPWEPEQTDILITECTFGLPVFHWKPQETVVQEILRWWQQNAENGQCSVLLSYALGKAQRLIHALSPYGQIFVHGAVFNMNETVKHILPSVATALKVEGKNKLPDYAKALIITTPSGFNSSWMNKFKPFQSAMVSGWMQIRGNKARRNTDTGFVMSDHADWNGLLQAVEQTKAEFVYTTHGFSESFSGFLESKGVNSEPLETQYGGEEDAE